jgi:TonB family protein
MKGSTALLIIMSVFMSGTMYFSYVNSQQIKALQQENAELWAKIDSSPQPVIEQPVNQPQEPVSPVPVIGEIKVTSKYRLEDRYVIFEVKEPEFLGNQVGEVVINISVNWSGDVKSAKLQKATGITDEEVIEACKKAALQTNFNMNSDTGYRTKTSGTITYIFTAK